MFRRILATITKRRAEPQDSSDNSNTDFRAFLGVVRMALRYKFTLVASVVCSLMVGVLWGANIGTLYPVLEVVVKGQSLSDSMAEKAAKSEKKSAELKAQLAEVEAKLDNAGESERPALEKRRKELASKLESEQLGHAATLRTQRLADRYLPATPFGTLAVIIGVMLVGTLLKGLFMAANDIFACRLVQRTMFDIRKRLFRSALRMDVGLVEQKGTSKLMSRLTHDVNHISGGLSTLFGQALREPLKLVSCLAGAAFVSWRLLLILLLVGPPGFFLVRYLAVSVKKNATQGMNAMAALYGRLSESFGGIRAVHAFNMQRYERNKFHYASKQILKRRLQIVRIRAFIKPMVELLSMAGVSATILVGAHLLLHRETTLLGISLTSRPLSPSAFLVFFGFLVGASDPIRKMSGVSLNIRRAAIATNRVFQFVSQMPKVRDPENPVPVPRPVGRIVFDNVRFRYPKGDPVLKGIALSIQHGERVALVGPNGCGKSTLVSLMLRFYDPNQGSIQLDDVDLTSVRVRELRDRIALVPQETILFDDTVLNNIRYGSPHATREQIVQAAREAFADDFISSDLDEGYDTVVGEKGCRLSGGQRQRIALARAFLRDPELLILDEATSHIDLESEKLIYEAIARSQRDCTVLIITHRATALEIVDRVIVMKRGKVVQSGSRDQFEELSRRDPWCQQMLGAGLRKSA